VITQGGENIREIGRETRVSQGLTFVMTSTKKNVSESGERYGGRRGEIRVRDGKRTA